MIKVEETSIADVKIIHPLAFEDHRGEYVETYNKRDYNEAGITIDFVQDDFSMSTQHVLRGLHGDSKTWKLVSCPVGKYYLVVLDVREDSPTFGKWEAFTVSDKNRKQVLIPPGCGNGHLIMSEFAIFQYKQSEYYDPSSQFTIKYNDERYNIWWPVKQPITSMRDELGHYV